MTFKVGDRVTYQNSDERSYGAKNWQGSTGTILEIRNGFAGSIIYDIEWDKYSPFHLDTGVEGRIGSHDRHKLIMAELKYDPMQQGDKDDDI